MIFSFFSTYEIHDIYSFVIPCNHGVVVSIMIIIKYDVWLNLISYHAFILITWHGWVCLKHQDNPNSYKDQTFFTKYIASIIKRQYVLTCQRKKFLSYVLKPLKYKIRWQPKWIFVTIRQPKWIDVIPTAQWWPKWILIAIRRPKWIEDILAT
jgi:hypothetical protein